MIKMENIRKVYDTGKIEVEALRGIDLHIRKSDFVTVIGPSGSGKSTLMNIMGCLDKPTTGEYKLNGQ
ncbi:MAG: ATP-binding cassette domain-containing protein, partial [Candidatus Marinimicrobia bacterium]|nr:ATP-binding cassette domain-containing protein [Candidatus Neomarinimicrobiota bacterium]